MTANQAPDFGPLFGWQSGKSGPDRDRRDRGESLGNSGPKSGAVRTVRNPPDCGPGIVNDSPESGRSHFLPLRGDASPDFSAVPSDSSAALTLRSQRTESGDSEERSVPGSGSEPSAPKLRPYQEEAIAAIDRELGSARRSTLLVLPTGCGKTVVFADLARQYVARQQRVLVLAHRGELLEQAQAKLHSAGVALAAIEQADRRASREHDVVIASVQTLAGMRMRKFPVGHFSLIIVDEAHHAAARSYRNILDYFASAKLLGVTATPDRGDGKALGKIFESVAFTYEMRRAIADGFLSPLVARRIEVDKLDLSDIRTHHGDFDQNELSKLLNEDENLLGVVKPLLEQAGDRKTLVFGVDVAHARALADTINAFKPGKAIALDGTAKPEERRAVLSLFRKGAFQYLCNCALFTEGFDEPDIACVALARPTQSRALYTQMLGRGTRLAPGKKNCLVLDFVGNSGKHKLVGPADALAGRELTDEERALVQKKLEDDPQLELDGVLADAEREAQEQKAAKRRQVNSAALVLYRQREVDLFLGDHMGEIDPDDPAAQRPATPEQLQEINEAKLGKPPIGISEAEARVMLKAVKERRKLGLCTVPQARLIERWGIDAKQLSFKRASELIAMVASVNGWNRVGSILSGQPEFKPNRRRS